MSGLNLKSRVNIFSLRNIGDTLCFDYYSQRFKIQNTTDALQAESEHSQAVAKIPHTYNTKCGQAVAIARCAKLAWVLGYFFFGGGWWWSWTVVKRSYSSLLHMCHWCQYYNDAVIFSKPFFQIKENTLYKMFTSL